MRTVHYTMWFIDYIRNWAQGDVAVVCGSLDDANWAREIIGHSPRAHFRFLTPGVYGSGRSFDQVVWDESFSYLKNREWFDGRVATRMKKLGSIHAFLP